MSRAIIGKVVSSSMKNTIIVEVTRLVRHPRYGKFVRISKRYHAHADHPIEVGATVSIQSTRPISKTKRWKVVGNKKNHSNTI